MRSMNTLLKRAAEKVRNDCKGSMSQDKLINLVLLVFIAVALLPEIASIIETAVPNLSAGAAALIRLIPLVIVVLLVKHSAKDGGK